MLICVMICFISMILLSPSYTLFPYTTLFRSRAETLIPPSANGGTGDLQPLGNLARRHELTFRHGDFLSRSEEHTSELQSRGHLVCRLLLEKKKINYVGKERAKK